jgi:PKD repeat protein
MRRGAAACLLFILLANALMVSGDGEADGAGSGALGRATSRATALIHDVYELQNMSHDLNGSYELACDIDASATRSWNGGAGFAPVGNIMYSFNGILDGKGHIISGLFINRSEAKYIGLIGRGGDNDVVRNIGLVNMNVTGRDRVGGLVGQNGHGTVNNSHCLGNVTGDFEIGGLVGSSGGIVDSSYFSGNITGGDYVGGLVGDGECLVVNSHASGNVTGSGNIGGILGGGFVNSIVNSYFSGSVNGYCYIGGLIGDDGIKTISNSYYNIDGVSINGGHHITAGGIFDVQYRDWVSSNFSLRISDYSNSLVPSGGWYDVDTLQGLRDLLGFANDARYRFRLTSDIDLHNDSEFCIPYLAGVFDGGNHTISNLTLELPFVHSLGLFGLNNAGTIMNVGLIDYRMYGYGPVGGLVAINHGTVNNSFAAGNVNGHFGGVSGGLVAVNQRDGAVNNSYAIGEADGTTDIGGLVGQNFGAVANSHAMVNVNGTAGVGGLVAENYGGGMILNSYATGSVNGWEDIGGLAGSNWATIICCYAAGNVTGTKEYVGGLVGYSLYGTVSNSYATGNVSGGGYVGGLVGYNNKSGMDNSYSAGNVVGSGNVGGLVGAKVDSTVSSCFWDDETSGQKTSEGGSGRTTAQMKTLGTFTGAGWDFIKMWCMVENCTYPLLRWQLAAPPAANAGPDLTVYCHIPATFDGSSSTDGVGIVDYTWNFADGAGNITLHGAAPSHTFCIPGVYGVILNITDFFGRWDTDELIVTVKKDVSPPVAEAGPDQMVLVGALVNFNGSGSSDNVGIVEYSWMFNDGDPVELYGVRPAHRFDNPGVFVITLNVTDAAGNWGTDTMNVTVVDPTFPSAEAGPDIFVDEGTSVTFDGSESYGINGIIKYTWTFMDGHAVTLYGITPAYKFNNPGVFVVKLNVTDARANWNTDTMTVTVNDTMPPVAEAGPDQRVFKADLVAFNGSGSHDNGVIVNFTWTLDDGASVSLYGISPTYTFKAVGHFVVTLTVTDAAGNMDVDTMTVIIEDIVAPVANAGSDQTVNEGTNVQFDGTGSWGTASIEHFIWTFADGAPVVLDGPRPTHDFRYPGVFVVTLNVTDVNGQWDTDTMTVTVKDTSPPVADAGPDQTVDEGMTVTFNGSGSSDNAGIVNYTWTFVYGTQRIVLYGVSPSFTFNFLGVYHITVNVSDAAGFRREDNMTLTVRDITPPVAAAGRDRTIPAGRTIVFDGSLSTDNVAISKFFWNFTCNGKAQSLEGKNVSFKFDKPGVYEVVLTVIDAAGNRGQDMVVVTVEPSVNNDNGSLPGLLWLPVLLIVIAVSAGYYIFIKRKSAITEKPGQSIISQEPGPSREMEEE